MSPLPFNRREAATVLQIGAQLSQNNLAIPGENSIFATTMGPQEALTVAKIAGGGFWHFVRYPAAVFLDKTHAWQLEP